MDILSNVSAVAVLLSIILLYSLWRTQFYSLKGKSPPEPSGAWPIIGHLHLLINQSLLTRTLGNLADEYGPVFTIKLGMDRALVVSSWESVKECFTINDKAFATRPPTSVSEHLLYNYAGFGFAPYGPYWRDMRKLVLLELLSSRKIETLKHDRVIELDTSIKELYSVIEKNGEDNPAKVVISQWIEQLALNVIVKTIAGKRYVNCVGGVENEGAKNFRRVTKEFMYVAGKFVVSDLIPFPMLKWMDFGGHIKSMKRISEELDAIIQSWIDEHIERRQKSEVDNDQDFIDVMLSEIDDKITYGHTRETIIKATVMTIMVAGAETTFILLTWLLSLLLNNRHIMERAQEEIETNIGRDRWVEESDIKHLIYLQATVKEALRLYPPAPLSVQHQAMEDCHVGGYLIPKGTRLIVNLWKLHRDPRVWLEPDEFLPDRFLTSQAEVDVYGQHYEYTPFGSGRRSCPGTAFAMRVAQLTIARLLQGFDFKTPLDLPVDMTEGLGLGLSKANQLEVLITPRLPDFLYGK